MSIRIRLARIVSKKKPYYRIVIANSTSPRDGKFLEKIGTYNPILTGDIINKVTLKTDRLLYWLNVGAQPTKRIAKFIQMYKIDIKTKIQNKINAKLKYLI